MVGWNRSETRRLDCTYYRAEHSFNARHIKMEDSCKLKRTDSYMRMCYLGRTDFEPQACSSAIGPQAFNLDTRSSDIHKFHSKPLLCTA